jgi:F-type H+-transporting ATPase subunit delta
MSSLAVARRYAGALVELAAERGSLEAVRADLDRFGATVAGAPALGDALRNPAFGIAERRAVVGKVLDKLSAHPHTRNFLSMLVDRDRFDSFSTIRETFDALYDERVGRVRAEVTSAAPLDPSTVEALRAHILRVTGKKEARLDLKVDASLIGGIITKIGDLVIDGSVRTRLAGLRERLIAGPPVGEA